MTGDRLRITDDQGRGRTVASRRLLPALFFTASLIALGALGSTAGFAAIASRTVVPGAASSVFVARPSQRSAGRVDFTVALRLRDVAGLDRFNEEVADPASASYGTYLSPSQFRRRYSPSRATVARVSSWLNDQDLAVERVSGNRTLIDVSGSAGAVERAFATRIVSGRSGGQSLTEATEPLSVPSEVAPAIISVAGLQGVVARPLAQPAEVPPPPIFQNARPCSRYWAQKYAKRRHKVKTKSGMKVVGLPDAYGDRQPWAPCGYTPHQLEGAYGVQHLVRHGLDGRGQTVAIIDSFAAPTIKKDLRIYSARHGLPPANIDQQVFKGPCKKCSIALRQGWFGEETLDVEAVHLMAPRAKIFYLGAANPGPGLLRVLNWVVNTRAARIVTNSYGALGEQTGLIAAQEQTSRQAIAEGIGIYFASGDDGNERDTIGYASADYPGSSPRVTAVGGSTLGVGPVNNFRFELGWQTYNSVLDQGQWSPDPPGDFYYGSGGQVSRLFAMPSYQRGVVPQKIAGIYGGSGRAVPDISMDGDPTTGMLTGETQSYPNHNTVYGEARFGGTSLSSPLFAGYMALADQLTGHPHGFVNPAIYQLAGSPAIRDIRTTRQPIAAVKRDFNDGFSAKKGFTVSLRTVGRGPPLQSRHGYDLSTGLGSPAGARLLRALARF